MVIKQGSHVFLMTYVGERCAVVGELAGMMMPDKKQLEEMATSPMVKTGEYTSAPVRDMGEGRRFVKLKNVIWTNGTKLKQKPEWQKGVEGRWLLALDLKPVSDEEWLGYAL